MIATGNTDRRGGVRRRVSAPLRVTLAALLAVAGTACGQASNGAGAAEPVAGTQVDVVDNAFEPSNLQVDAGDTVTWVWSGSNDHNVVGDEFASDIQQAGTFEYTFHEPGEFDYVCALHPGMEGTITVVQ